ncbi:MAG: sensor histidine kinase [Candidatus Peribacteraceae bacterium]
MPRPASRSAEYAKAAWLRLRWGLPFAAALLPIIFLSIYSLQIASRSVRDLVESANRAAASNVSQLLTQDFIRTVNLADAIASVPGTVEAVQVQDDMAMRTRLKAVVLAYPQIDRAFVTDRNGILWADYPQAPGVFGKSQTQTDWYRGLSAQWKPYISRVYLQSFDSKAPVVAIAAPVLDETGGVAGALVVEYRTDQVQRWLQGIRLGMQGYVYVLDQEGVVVAHPDLPEGEFLQEGYAGVEALQAARSGSTLFTQEYRDPISWETMMATFQPLAVGGSRWTVVAQQPKEEAFAPLNRVKWSISLAGVILTLFTLGMVLALARSSRRITLLNAELAAKNITLRDITSFVTHQLRAPVTSMSWMLESMLDGDYGALGDELRKGLQELKDIAFQNGVLINDILNVSRLDRGVLEVRAVTVPLAAVADRALRDYLLPIERSGLKLVREGEKEEILVLADKEKMAEAVANSISNALKHTKSGSITLRLRKDGQYGYIDVADTGEGVPPERLPHLFTRAGVKGTNTASTESTGLGLFIARSFMRLQKGEITVESLVGKGTKFTYSIPLSRYQAAPPQAENSGIA